MVTAVRSKSAKTKSQQSKVISDTGIVGQIIPPDKNHDTEIHEVSMWHGPLPSPEDLAHYKKLSPDAVERLFRDFEANSQHLREFEMAELKADFKLKMRSLNFAFLSILIFIFSGIWFLFAGYPNIAAILVGSTMAFVVGSFLYDRNHLNRASDQNSKNVPPKKRR
ncbi:MAG: hypothetical protein QM523_05235 [Candidatus Pacebacteria bacterium]|nr:hypothetical protein [Candidatus Paceibacterota bacterium]